MGGRRGAGEWKGGSHSTGLLSKMPTKFGSFLHPSVSPDSSAHYSSAFSCLVLAILLSCASNLLLHTTCRLPALVLMHVDFTRFLGTCRSSDVILRSGRLGFWPFFLHNSSSRLAHLVYSSVWSQSSHSLMLWSPFPCPSPVWLQLPTFAHLAILLFLRDPLQDVW